MERVEREGVNTQGINPVVVKAQFDACRTCRPVIDKLAKVIERVEDERDIANSTVRILQDEMQAVKDAFTNEIVADLAAARAVLEKDLGDLVVDISGWKVIAAKLAVHEQRIKAALAADALR